MARFTVTNKPMPDKTSYEVVDGIAVITIDNPPVNAMSTAVRKSCRDALDRLAADASARAAVLICTGRTFIAGADITEFDKPVEDPWLPDLVEKFEASEKLIVAAIHGAAWEAGWKLPWVVTIGVRFHRRGLVCRKSTWVCCPAPQVRNACRAWPGQGKPWI